MTLEWVAQPISEDQPAGDDLWGEDDPAFLEYYQDAMGRLPEGDDYARIGLDMGNGNKMPDTIFDPKSVDLAKEIGQVDGLLKRTRDIRLLTLRAQWAILAGDVAQTNESVGAMADLLEVMPQEAHPQTSDGIRDRLEAINDLVTMGAMILPLRYLDIADTGTSWRRFMVANGEVTPHLGEDDLTTDALTRALSEEKDSAEDTHADLLALNSNLERVELACLSHSSPHTPQFRLLKDEIQAVVAVIAKALPSLSAGVTDDAPSVDTGRETERVIQATSASAGEVKSQDEARSRLIAVETYFGRHEPSSAAVLLVTQARQLIGKSLVDAFDILMPNSAELAKVEFISDNGFQLAHPRLRQLADQVLIEDGVPQIEPVAPPPPEPMPEPEPVEEASAEVEDSAAEPIEDEAMGGQDDATEPEPPVEQMRESSPFTPQVEQTFKVRSPGEAASQILAVETYFRAVEKSSPVPMLLGRARSFIGKDFETILKELVPRIE